MSSNPERYVSWKESSRNHAEQSLKTTAFDQKTIHFLSNEMFSVIMQLYRGQEADFVLRLIVLLFYLMINLIIR